MDLYHISLHAVERQMKRQTGKLDDRQLPETPKARPDRISISSRVRLTVSTVLRSLASTLDPSTSAPSRQHG